MKRGGAYFCTKIKETSLLFQTSFPVTVVVVVVVVVVFIYLFLYTFSLELLCIVSKYSKFQEYKNILNESEFGYSRPENDTLFFMYLSTALKDHSYC